MKTPSTFIIKTISIFLFVGFICSFFYFSRIDSFELKIDPSLYKISESTRIKKKITDYLNSHKGEFTWLLDLKQVAKQLRKIYPAGDIQIVRKLPNKILVILEKEQAFLIIKNKTQFYSVSFEGAIGAAIDQGQPMDFPILRGDKFWKNKNLRKRIIEILVKLPGQGEMSLKNISEIKYLSKNDSFLLFLVSHNFAVEIKSLIRLQQINNINFVLNYLIKKKMLAQHVDSRFDKKIIVNKLK